MAIVTLHTTRGSVVGWLWSSSIFPTPLDPLTCPLLCGVVERQLGMAVLFYTSAPTAAVGRGIWLLPFKRGHCYASLQSLSQPATGYLISSFIPQDLALPPLPPPFPTSMAGTRILPHFYVVRNIGMQCGTENRYGMGVGIVFHPIHSLCIHLSLSRISPILGLRSCKIPNGTHAGTQYCWHCEFVSGLLECSHGYREPTEPYMLTSAAL